MRLSALWSALAILVAAAGCSEPAAPQKPPASKKFVIILKAAPADVAAAAKAAADKWTKIETVEALDAAKQMAALKDALAAKADGVAIDCVPAPEVSAAIAEVVAAGIPVVTYNTDCPGTPRTGLEGAAAEATTRQTFIGADPSYVGKLLAYELAQQFGSEGGMVAVISADGPEYKMMEEAIAAYLKSRSGIGLKAPERVAATPEAVTAAIAKVLQQESNVRGWIFLNPGALPDKDAKPLEKLTGNAAVVVALAPNEAVVDTSVVGADRTVDALVAPPYAGFGSAVVQMLTAMTRNHQNFPALVHADPAVLTSATLADLERVRDARKKILAGQQQFPVVAMGAPKTRASTAASTPTAGGSPTMTGDTVAMLVAEKTKDIKDFTADLKFRGVIPNTEGVSSFEGQAKALSPNYQWLAGEHKGAGAQAITSMKLIFNGKVAFMELTGAQGTAAIKIDFDELKKLDKDMAGVKGFKSEGGDEPENLINPFKDLVRKEAAMKVTKSDGDLVTVEALKKLAPGSEGPAERLVITINKTTGLVQSIETYKGAQLDNALELSNIKTNTGLKAADFDYLPPAGAQVMDVAQMMRAMAESFKKMAQPAESAATSGAAATAESPAPAPAATTESAAPAPAPAATEAKPAP